MLKVLDNGHVWRELAKKSKEPKEPEEPEEPVRDELCPGCRAVSNVWKNINVLVNAFGWLTLFVIGLYSIDLYDNQVRMYFSEFLTIFH